jgi:Rod binding domain-containing protein
MADLHSASTAELDTKDLKAKAAAAKNSDDAAKTKKMGEEFEAMFLRQILTQAKIGGASKSGGSGGGDGYQSMTVDALATTISKNGGMGLAKQIEDMVGHAEHHQRVLNTAITVPSVSGGASAAATASTAVTPTSSTNDVSK